MDMDTGMDRGVDVDVFGYLRIYYLFATRNVDCV